MRTQAEAASVVPVAKWRGELDLGGTPVECYVLDDGERVIATRSAIKAFADADSGNLGNYIGVSNLKSYLNSDLILGGPPKRHPRVQTRVCRRPCGRWSQGVA